MKTGRYKCVLDHRGNNVYDITVDAKETEKSFILNLVEDNSRYPDGHMNVLFGKSGKAVISKNGSDHSLVNEQDWFVVYPNRNGVPFLFEYQEDLHNGGRKR